MTDKPKHTVYHSTVLDADPDTVWAVVRDIVAVVKLVFGDAVQDVGWTAHGSVDKVPSRFNFTLLPNHDLAREEVVGRNEAERSLTYRSVAQVLSIYDYVATYRVLPVTTDPTRSFIEWSREFRVTDDAAPNFVDGLLAMIGNEIEAVRAHFAKS